MISIAKRLTGSFSLIILSSSAVLASPSPADSSGRGFHQGQPWAHFSRFPFSSRLRESVDIGSGKQNESSGFRYILRLTSQRGGNRPVMQWADSLTCPSIGPMIASMTKLAMPAPAPYGVPGVNQDIVLDGTNYEFSSPSSYESGNLTITSNSDSPLARWVDDALKRLAPCWSVSPPKS